MHLLCCPLASPACIKVYVVLLQVVCCMLCVACCTSCTRYLCCCMLCVGSPHLYCTHALCPREGLVPHRSTDTTNLRNHLCKKVASGAPPASIRLCVILCWLNFYSCLRRVCFTHTCNACTPARLLRLWRLVRSHRQLSATAFPTLLLYSSHRWVTILGTQLADLNALLRGNAL